jgi:hypothetical protein
VELFDTYKSTNCKLLRCEVEHRSPSSAKVKNEWSYTSTTPVCLCSVDGKKFTFYLLPILNDSKIFNILVWKWEYKFWPWHVTFWTAVIICNITNNFHVQEGYIITNQVILQNDFQNCFFICEISFHLIYFTIHSPYTAVQLVMYTFSIINKATVQKLCLIVVSQDSYINNYKSYD